MLCLYGWDGEGAAVGILHALVCHGEEAELYTTGNREIRHIFN